MVMEAKPHLRSLRVRAKTCLAAGLPRLAGAGRAVYAQRRPLLPGVGADPRRHGGRHFWSAVGARRGRSHPRHGPVQPHEWRYQHRHRHRGGAQQCYQRRARAVCGISRRLSHARGDCRARGSLVWSDDARDRGNSTEDTNPVYDMTVDPQHAAAMLTAMTVYRHLSTVLDTNPRCLAARGVLPSPPYSRYTLIKIVYPKGHGAMPGVERALLSDDTGVHRWDTLHGKAYSRHCK